MKGNKKVGTALWICDSPSRSNRIEMVVVSLEPRDIEPFFQIEALPTSDRRFLV